MPISTWREIWILSFENDFRLTRHKMKLVSFDHFCQTFKLGMDMQNMRDTFATCATFPREQ